MTIERYNRRVALVTGASSGIGAAIAQELVKQGLVVVGMARRIDRIKALDVKGFPGTLHAIKGDITNEEDILNTFKWIKDNLGGVDVLVNNAGVFGEPELTDSDTSEWRRIFDVNVIGLSICTREAVKGMRERGVDDGYIIHISSIAAHLPVIAPHIAMYAASKYALNALTEGLRKDLVASGTNIRNTTISPGLVKTEILDGLKKMDPEKVWSLPHMLPEDIAEVVTFILSQPLRVQSRMDAMVIERYKGRVALVTGASSGIGAAIVEELVKQGLVVVGMARRVERIEPLDVKDGPGTLHAIKADITSEEEILETFNWIDENLGGVDVLVNNAGISGESELTDADTSEWRRIFDVNVIGLSICTREAVKRMKERGVDDGYIIHISSISAHMPVIAPYIAMYTASKYAVNALTEGLRKDLAGSGTNIRNTTISPGLVKTEILDGFKKMDPDKVWMLPHLLPEDVAKAITFVLSQPLRVQIQDILMNEANSKLGMIAT